MTAQEELERLIREDEKSQWMPSGIDTYILVGVKNLSSAILSKFVRKEDVRVDEEKLLNLMLIASDSFNWEKSEISFATHLTNYISTHAKEIIKYD